MEKAIILSPSLVNRPGIPELIKNKTVYLGDEFCIHKQPSFRDFSVVKALTGKNPVLLSTLLTDPAMDRWKKLLAECAKKAPGTEIVINDIGLLRFIDKNYRGRFSLTLGRLLTYFFDPKHARLPGCTRPTQFDAKNISVPSCSLAAKASLGLEGKKPEAWETGLGNTPIEYIKDFLKRYGIKRVETDSAQVFHKYAGNTRVKISFHHPLRLMTMTRFCPFMGGIVAECKAPCGDRLLSLKTPHLDFAMFVKGNAYFAKNRPPKSARLDRTVLTPYTNSAGFKPAANKYSSPDRPA